MAGFSHDAMLGKTDFDILTDQRARHAFEDERKIMETGQPLIGKMERDGNPDGRVSWVLTTKMPWRNTEGRIIGTFGISRDITPIKEAEAKLERAQVQLMEASRKAGMAEVATGVLHNVGNVLNSVNVSTNLLIQEVGNFKVNSVRRVAALMKDHAADLGDFLTNDPKGQRMPQFLWDLSDELGCKQAHALQELHELQAHVDHIKAIVAMQQDYATVGGVITSVRIPELIEDVLRLTESSLDRHGVKVAKQLDQHLPDISVDRHKVLQILVNLTRNAKHACEDAQRSDKQLTLRATTREEWLTISVADNGVGIPTENLTRIFAHGYTTRKNGHGFGLHSSALAAKEIGGRLVAHSDGPGQGAIFTLELKLDRQAVAQTVHD
jgi:PAS domain S-box-containing protein